MKALALNTVDEMTQAVEDMEFVLRHLKSDLALIKKLAGRVEARDYSGIPYRRCKPRRVVQARALSN